MLRFARTAFALIAIPICATLALAQEKPTLTIGGEQDQGYQLGNPRGVVVTGNRIVVIEPHAPFLRVLTKAGKLVQSFGQLGAGPGEFSTSTTFVYDSVNRQLLAFDLKAGRLSSLALGDTLKFLKTRSVMALPRAVCLLGSTLWAITGGKKLITELRIADDERLQPGRTLGTIHWLNPVGAEPFAHDYAVTAGGLLACDPRTHMAIVMSPMLGEAHLLAIESGTQRLERILDFIPTKVTASRDRISYEFPENGVYDDLVGALVSHDGVEAVVARHTPVRGSRNDKVVHRRVLMLADGTQRVVGQGQWRPMAFAPDGAYCYVADPAPTIARFGSGQCP